ncbi:MAG: hypothetical protein HFH49_09465 [Lachnospiraceae bacterium]|nr:hypothetical protein [Lachnospiraceae bacterium]
MSVQRKKFCNAASIFRTMRRQAFGDRRQWFLWLIIQSAASFFYLYRMNYIYACEYGLTPCKADFFIWMDMLPAKYTFVLPVALCIFMKLGKELESEQFLIRKVHRRSVWYEMFIRTAVVSVLLTAVTVTAVSIYAAVNDYAFMNWNEKRSLYWFFMNGQVCTETISFWKVIFCFSSLNFLKYFFTGMAAAVTRIIIASPIPAWIFCMGTALFDYGRSRPLFFYGKYSVDYANWEEMHFLEMALSGGILILLISAGGLAAIRRKNYYGKANIREK